LKNAFFESDKMMNYLLMFLTILVLGVQSIFRKQFNNKTEGVTSAPYVFNFLAAIASLVFLLFFGLAEYRFHLQTTIYACAFGILSEVAMVTILYAFMYGSLSLTSLLLSYSIILPALYGILVLHEPFRWTTGVGLLLLVVSLYLFNKKKENLKITKKWLIFVSLLFLSNGICATLMKVHQYHFPGEYTTEFQGTSFLIVALLNALILLFMGKKRAGAGKAFSKGSWLAALFGICSVGANLLTMILAAKIPAAILYPVVSGGGIVSAYVIGRFIYKEKMSAIQNVAFLISLVSIVVLNL